MLISVPVGGVQRNVDKFREITKYTSQFYIRLALSKVKIIVVTNVGNKRLYFYLKSSKNVFERHF